MEITSISTVTVPKTPSKSSKTVSDKIRCLLHKKEKVQFICQVEKVKICGLCVPQHTGHSLINLKEQCGEILKKWTKLKMEASNWKKKLESLADKIPSEKMETFNKRVNALNDKYEEILGLKRDFDYDQLVAETEAEINRYKDKIILFAKGQFEKYNIIKQVESATV